MELFLNWIRTDILFLVNVGDIASLGLLNNDGDSVRVLLPDAVGLSLPLLCDKWQMYNENSVTIKQKDIVLHKEKPKTWKSPRTMGTQ